MWKLLKWIFIGWAGVLVLCDMRLQTSIYRYEDNRVELRLPRWQADTPWARLIWHAGQWQWDWYSLEGARRPLDIPPE